MFGGIWWSRYDKEHDTTFKVNRKDKMRSKSALSEDYRRAKARKKRK